MHGSAQPEDRLESTSGEDTLASPADSAGEPPIGPSIDDRSLSRPPAGDQSPRDPANANRALEETELDSALQLLVERAQYITGATGTALALPQGDEMVCRASAGSSAPAVGARLQVRSGLTGESIARRQLLRCDNAEADARVNLDACRALGIASIVVLPLLRKNGDVRGLFELFSDHPYAFEERDLIALERMAALTVTALDLAEQQQKFVPAVLPRREPESRELESRVASSAPGVAPAETKVESPAPEMESATSSISDVSELPADAQAIVPLHSDADNPANSQLVEPPVTVESPVVSSSEEPVVSALPAPAVVTPAVVAAPIITMPSLTPPSVTPAESEPPAIAAVVPEAMRRVQKCAACGFPVSEGRALCLDCEKKDSGKKALEQKERERERERNKSESAQPAAAPTGAESAPDLAPAAASQQEFIPAFLANAAPAQESWLADHVNLLAIIVLILGILVAVVVFR
ncbi:MAG: GAF domain-containing protein [Terriglobales bacterium]